MNEMIKYPVLLVDDSPDDRLFMKWTVNRSHKLRIVFEACDGQEAIDYLLGHGDFADRDKYPLPDVVLLDLKMPRVNGFDVLLWIRKELPVKIPVIMVSGSWLAEDISKSMELGADGYLKKTPVRKEQDQMLIAIENVVMERRGQNS